MGPTLELEKVSFGPGSSGAIRPAGDPPALSVAVGVAFPSGCGVGSRFAGGFGSGSRDDSIGVTGRELLGTLDKVVVSVGSMLLGKVVVTTSRSEVEEFKSAAAEVRVASSSIEATDSAVDEADVSPGRLGADEEVSDVVISGSTASLVAAT